MFPRLPPAWCLWRGGPWPRHITALSLLLPSPAVQESCVSMAWGLRREEGGLCSVLYLAAKDEALGQTRCAIRIPALSLAGFGTMGKSPSWCLSILRCMNGDEISTRHKLKHRTEVSYQVTKGPTLPSQKPDWFASP